MIGLASRSDFLERYRSLGLAVVPLRPGTKKAKRRGWRLKSAEELLAIFEEGDNVGLRLEKPFFVIDIDDRRLLALILDEVGQTLIVETRRGYHLYLKAESHYPQNNKKSRLIQLLSEGCQVVAPPSVVNGHTYRFVDPNAAIATLDDRAVGKLERIVEAIAKYEKIIVGFANAWSEGHRHNLSLWLNGALRKAGVPRFEAAVVVKSICLLADDPEINDRLTALKTTYERDIAEVAGWSKLREELTSIVGEEKAEQFLRLLPRPEEGEESKKIRYTPFVELDNGRLCEMCFNGKESFFVVYDQSSGRIEKLSEVGDGEIVYRPLNSPEVGRIVVLPSDIEEYGSDSELFNQILDFLSRYHYSPNEWEKKLDALYAMLTWIYDVLPIVPYRKITGPKGSGKSTWLKVMGSICYRSLFISGASSEASLLRLIDRWRGTLLIDEADLGDTSFLSTLVKALNVGFDKKMGYFTRCERENPSHVDTFYVFGPKIAVTRESFSDDALESRFITTRPFKQPFARFLGQTFEAEAERLRNRLLLWRLRNYYRIRERVAMLEDPSLHKTVFGDGGVDPRVAQILLPLLILTEDDDLRGAIIRLGELLTLASESDEEALFREAIRIMENEVSPEEEAEIMGEKYLAYWLNVLVERLAPDADLSERKALARKVARILRARGCLIKRGTGGRRLVYVPYSLVSVTTVTPSLEPS
jgi:rubredoxin